MGEVFCLQLVTQLKCNMKIGLRDAVTSFSKLRENYNSRQVAIHADEHHRLHGVDLGCIIIRWYMVCTVVCDIVLLYHDRLSV